MVILSLSTVRGKVRFDFVFPIEIPLFHGKPLFHFKPSGIYFEGFLFSSGFFDVIMNSVNFCGRASSQLARIATISGRPAVENICVFLSKVDRASFSLSTGASRPSPTPHIAHQKKSWV